MLSPRGTAGGFKGKGHCRSIDMCHWFRSTTKELKVKSASTIVFQISVWSLVPSTNQLRPDREQTALCEHLLTLHEKIEQ